MKKVLPAAVAIAGLALVIWQIRQVGIDQILEGFRAVGPAGFAGILALSFLRFTARSIAWTALIVPPPGHTRVPLRSAIAATLGGDALGNLSFLSLLVSEPTKALYVTKHVPGDEALGALTAENFFYSVSVAIVVVAGSLTLLATLVLPDAWRSAALVSLGMMSAILLAAMWIVWKRPALAGRRRAKTTSEVDARSVRASTSEVVSAKLAEVERITYRSLRAAPWSLGAVILLEVGFHVLSVLESWLTLYLLTGESQWLNAFLLDTLNRVINVAFRVVPLRVGVDEVSASGLAGLLGIGSATGLTMALVRKARLLTWISVGVALIGRRAIRQ